jgi:hypothetical protein
LIFTHHFTAAMTTAATKPKLAYLVNADEATEIVYATSAVAARRQGARDMGLDFEDVDSTRRAAYLDKYAEGGDVPTKMLIEEHGWRFECSHCFGNVDHYEEARVYDEYESPYCCAGCMAAEQAKQAQCKADKEALTALVGQKCPGATICWLNQDKGLAFLRIPTADAGALWDSNTNQFLGQPRDQSAWNDYKASLNA